MCHPFFEVGKDKVELLHFKKQFRSDVLLMAEFSLLKCFHFCYGIPPFRLWDKRVRHNIKFSWFSLLCLQNFANKIPKHKWKRSVALHNCLWIEWLDSFHYVTGYFPSSNQILLECIYLYNTYNVLFFLNIATSRQ